MTHVCVKYHSCEMILRGAEGSSLVHVATQCNSPLKWHLGDTALIEGYYGGHLGPPTASRAQGGGMAVFIVISTLYFRGEKNKFFSFKVTLTLGLAPALPASQSESLHQSS